MPNAPRVTRIMARAKNWPPTYGPDLLGVTTAPVISLTLFCRGPAAWQRSVHDEAEALARGDGNSRGACTLEVSRRAGHFERLMWPALA